VSVTCLRGVSQSKVILFLTIILVLFFRPTLLCHGLNKAAWWSLGWKTSLLLLCKIFNNDVVLSMNDVLAFGIGDVTVLHDLLCTSLRVR
jgi:hypothetical protein